MTLANSIKISYLFIFMLSCTVPGSRIQEVQHSQITVGKDFIGIDSATYKMILPYKEKLNTELNETIGTLGMPIAKSPKVGTMGNLIADIIKTEGESELGIKADFALINNGGMRLADLAAGPIGLVKIYELLPFDNQVIMLELEAEIMQALIEHIIARNMDGLSGISISKGGDEVLIDGQHWDRNKHYKVLTIDFLHSGGDGFDMLAKAKLAGHTNQFLRDLVINYIKKQDAPLMTTETKRLDL